MLMPRACLKNHSCNLHAPLCGIFCPNSVAVARYGALIRTKSPTNCDAHLAESLFQTRSSIFGEDLFDDWMRLPVERETNRGYRAAELMKTDIKDVDGNYKLSMDLPGFHKEDVKIQLKDGYLNIQASRTENKDEKDNNGKYVHRERYTGQCSRSFYVGKELEHEDIHAKYDNGVLTVTFPKEAKKKVPEEKKFISIEG